MTKKFRAFIAFMTSKYTFMVIPNSTKKAFQFTIPKIIIVLFLFINIFYISNLTIHNYSLSKENKIITSKYNFVSNEMEHYENYSSNLKSVLNTQSVDLNAIKKQLVDEKEIYSTRLEEISNLEDEFVYVLNKFNYDNNFDIEVASSRSIIQGRESISSSNKLEQEEFMNLIELDINEHTSLIKEIEDKLDFLECKPDLIPVKGRISSSFGPRNHPVTGNYDFHDGIDIVGNIGTPIKAAGAGIITFNGRSGSYGNILIISHGYGYKTIYAHTKKNFVAVGDTVEKGEIIAEIGLTGTTTGPHLHFEIHKDGKLINPKEILNLK
ncbi:MAG: M23 family metallopeptidase [Bacillota bacterium]|nr:M23 family metallopeptidase [Bacillota bacterium]